MFLWEGGMHSTRGPVQVQAHTGACSGLYMPFAAGGAGPRPDSSLLLCPGWRWHTLSELQNLPLQCLLHHPKPHFTDRKTEAVKAYGDRAKPHPGKKKQTADVSHVLSLHSCLPCTSFSGLDIAGVVLLDGPLSLLSFPQYVGSFGLGSDSLEPV